MKTKLTALLCLLALLFCACTDESEDVTPGTVNISRAAEKSGIVRLKSEWWGGNDLDRLTTEDDRQSVLESFREKYGDRVCRDYVKKAPGEAEAALVTREDDAALEEFYARGADWLTALYATSHYESKEQMMENLRFRREYLAEDFDAYLAMNGLLEELAGELWGGAGMRIPEGFEVGSVKNVYENGLTGFVFRFTLYFTADTQSDVPKYFAHLFADYSSYYVSLESGEGYPAFRGYSPLWVELLTKDGKIEGWRELSKDVSKKLGARELIADEAGIRRTEGFQAWPTLPDKTSEGESWERLMVTQKKQALTELGTTLYKAVIGLDHTRSQEADFDAILSLCSPSLREQLTKEDFFGSLVRDCAEYGVRVEIDPVYAKTIDSEVYVYSATHGKYGTVYLIRRGAFMRTGSQTFNEKYALNDEGFYAEMTVYMAESDERYQIVAFRIRADLDENAESAADEYWNGTGDRG